MSTYRARGPRKRHLEVVLCREIGEFESLDGNPAFLPDRVHGGKATVCRISWTQIVLSLMAGPTVSQESNDSVQERKMVVGKRARRASGATTPSLCTPR